MFFATTFRNTVARALWLHPRARLALLRATGLEFGHGTFLSPPAMFKGTHVVTGPGCYLNSGLFVGRGALTLGRNVFVGPDVMFITSSHELGPATRRAGKDIKEPITVGDGVWIGGRAVILGGVHIASGCVIAAASLVTKDTEPNGLYVGAPARRVRDLP